MQQTGVEQGAHAAESDQRQPGGGRGIASQSMTGPPRRISPEHVGRAVGDEEELAESGNPRGDHLAAGNDEQNDHGEPGERRCRTGGLPPAAFIDGVGVGDLGVAGAQEAREPGAAADLKVGDFGVGYLAQVRHLTTAGDGGWYVRHQTTKCDEGGHGLAEATDEGTGHHFDKGEEHQLGHDPGEPPRTGEGGDAAHPPTSR